MPKSTSHLTETNIRELIVQRLGVVIAIAGGVLALVAMGFFLFPSAKKTTETPLTTQTKQILAAADKYRSAAPASRPRAKQSFIAIAEKRLNKMRSIIATHPDQVLAAAISKDKLSSLPKELQAYTEQWIATAGSYGMMISDDFEKHQAKTWHIFTTTDAKTTYNLYPTDELDTLLPSQTPITGFISGVLIDNNIALTPEAAMVDTPTDQPAAVTTETASTNTPKVLAILYYFTSTGLPADAGTAEEVNDFLVGARSDSVKNYYLNDSYGIVTFSADTFGTYALNVNNSTCDDVDRNLVPAALQAVHNDNANNPNFSFDGYTDLVLIGTYRDSSGNGCGAGRSTIGPIQTGVPPDQHIVNMSRQWHQISRSVYFAPETFAHELGHGQMLWEHANVMDCGTTSLGPSGCSHQEYGDLKANMGSAYAYDNLVMKESRNWLVINGDLASQHVLLNLDPQMIPSGQAEFTLKPLGSQLPGLKGLKIMRAKGVTTYYDDYLYIEYRQPIGSDNNGGGLYINGATVHTRAYLWRNIPRASYLIDASAYVNLPPFPIPPNGNQDPTLTPNFVNPDTGQGGLIDPLTGVLIEVLENHQEIDPNNSYLRVRVTLPDSYDFDPPVTTITQPIANANLVGSVSPVNAYVTDRSGIQSVEFRISGPGRTDELFATTTTPQSGQSVTSATATATLASTSVQSITVTDSGSFYNQTPTVTITGGGGSGAMATATVQNKRVTSITVTNHGGGYTSVPTVIISGGGGNGAAATATLAPRGVGSLSIVSGGSGYTATPAVTITGGGGNGAQAAVTLSSGLVTSLTMTNPGSGYTSIPNVSISGGGTDAVFAGQLNIGQYLSGSYTITATATDTLGNVSTTTPLPVVIANPPPTATFISPSQNARISGSSSPIYVRATDDSAIQRVGFMITKSGTDFYQYFSVSTRSTGSPQDGTYELRLNTTQIPNGMITIEAKAYDGPGNVSTGTTLSVEVVNTDVIPPSVSFTEPTPWQITFVGFLPITVTASDNNGIYRVELYQNDTSLGTCDLSYCNRNIMLYSYGPHRFRAMAYDYVGNSQEATVVVFKRDPADNTPPTVSLTSPGNTIYGQIPLPATATDTAGIYQVEFLVADASGTTSTLGYDLITPYGFYWDTNVLPNGNYTIIAKAYDNNGWTTTSTPINVTIQNVSSGSGCEDVNRNGRIDVGECEPQAIE